jgi:molybdate transport system substrate-binding protein
MRHALSPTLRKLAAGLAAGLLLSCAAQAQEITVSAAASLQNAFREIGTAYEHGRPGTGTKVNFNFAASGPLLAQIEQGAPVDVFASADLETMARAEAKRLIADGSRIDFAGNTLVVVSPIGLAPTVKTLADLGKPEVQRIAIGNPATVPAGHYAQAALNARGLWPALTPKFVYAENVRQALNYVSRGEAQAGFVYRTDAFVENGKVRIDFAVPTTSPVRYPAAVVRASTQAKAAGDFVRFLQGPAAQEVLKRHGFTAAQ